MNAEQYLKQIKKYDYIIANKVKEYQHWVDVADGMGGCSTGDRVQSQRNLHKGSDAIAKYIDVESEIKELRRKRQEILNTLQRLDPIEYEVLYKIYLEDLMLKELCSIFNKSYAWVKNEKKKALKHLQEIIDKKEK
jgi:DNA-directed RNA polymerase specialized sigma24 family protein